MKSISTKLLLVVAALVAALLACLDFFYFLPAQQQLLQRNLVEKARAISTLYGSSLTKSIESNDDIGLLIQIDNMNKLEDISAVFVLDNSGKVLLHNKSSEWGKTYNEPIFAQAIAAKKTRLTPYAPVDGFLYSAPLTSSGTLCVGLSTKKNDGLYNAAQNTAIILSVIALVILLLVLLPFVGKELKSKFAKQQAMLKSIMLANGGSMEVSGADEFAETAKLINEMLGKISGGAQSAASTGSGASNQLLSQALSRLTAAILIIDADNKIIAANEKARSILGLAGDVVGHHILDAFSAPELIKTVQQANAMPAMPAVININGTAVCAQTLTDGSKILGTVITA